MNEKIKEFKNEVAENILKQSENQDVKNAAIEFMDKSIRSKYSYNFTWMGRPIIAYPQDMIAMQEIIWDVKPDLIIEAGVAHGGSIIYYASLLELLGGDRKVIGIDIDIRKHNREEIENHSMFKRITLIEGSSIEEQTLNQVKEIAKNYKNILVCLDSNHTHDHVLKEIQMYSPLVSVGSYCVVFDTIIENMPEGYFTHNRPWDKGNNPFTSVVEFLNTNDNFVINHEIDNKILISVAPSGYLKRIK